MAKWKRSEDRFAKRKRPLEAGYQISREREQVFRQKVGEAEAPPYEPKTMARRRGYLVMLHIGVYGNHI